MISGLAMQGSLSSQRVDAGLVDGTTLGVGLGFDAALSITGWVSVVRCVVVQVWRLAGLGGVCGLRRVAWPASVLAAVGLYHR